MKLKPRAKRGETLAIRSDHLNGTNTAVQLMSPRLTDANEVAPLGATTATRIQAASLEDSRLQDGGSHAARQALVLELQRTIGNRATRALIQGLAPALPASTAPRTTGLPGALSMGLEQLSGLALGEVRVHYNSARPAQVQALAYTLGAEIHLAPGQEQHLAHEAWHVVQQRQDRVPPTRRAGDVAINDDPSLEREAEVMGARALSGASRLAGAPRIPPVEAPAPPAPVVQRVLSPQLKRTVGMFKAKLNQLQTPEDRRTKVMEILQRAGAAVTEEHITEAAALAGVTVASPAVSAETAAQESLSQEEPPLPESPAAARGRILAEFVARRMKYEALATLAALYRCTSLYDALGTLKSRRPEAQTRLRNALVFDKYATDISRRLPVLTGGEDGPTALAAFVKELEDQMGAIQIIPLDAGQLTAQEIVQSLRSGWTALEIVLGAGAPPAFIAQVMFAHDKGYVATVDSASAILDAVVSGTVPAPKTRGAQVDGAKILAQVRHKSTKTDIFTGKEDGLTSLARSEVHMTYGERLQELIDTEAPRTTMTVQQAQIQKRWYRPITPPMYLIMWGQLAGQLLTALKLEDLGQIKPYLPLFKQTFPELPEAAFAAFNAAYPDKGQ